jgi:hypothetical protein
MHLLTVMNLQNCEREYVRGRERFRATHPPLYRAS